MPSSQVADAPQVTPEEARRAIYGEIEQERNAQDEEHGGPAADDQHTHHDWVAFIVAHMGLGVKGKRWTFRRDKFRRSMVVIATLAVAAIEWCDRRRARSLDEEDGGDAPAA